MWNGKRDKVEKQTRDGNGTEGRNEGGKQDGNDGADENENIDNGITSVRE